MSGVGTELGKLIPTWASKQKKGCPCNNRKTKYDKWGVAKCQKLRRTIARELASQKHLLSPPLRLLPRKALEAAALNLVDKAISNARR